MENNFTQHDREISNNSHQENGQKRKTGKINGNEEIN